MYDKIFYGNKYYQDLPIEYDEIDNDGLIEYYIEILRFQY